ncbi:Valine--pyruvate aminotransferase [hydrothermal vent metagenome]|uniref:Valine--pyruvate aminotransferase n=1 Tax=hydrothermal vent metagenome TaxID=652676 RepID=A0A3B0XSQ3_9ZZZZ
MSRKNILQYAQRLTKIQPFHVMDILAQAKSLEGQGESIIHLEVGEPDFPTPTEIVNAGILALQENKTQYTAATGLTELKEAIALFYSTTYSKEINPDTILITPGASGALLLCLSILLDSGDKVLMTDPGYPCNKNIVTLLGASPVLVPLDADTDFLPSVEDFNDAWDDNVKAILIASPANPTGSVIPSDLLAELINFCELKNIALIIDEIYLGLSYEDDNLVQTSANISKHCFVINSFSKYFCMTGWRLGWIIAPESAVKSLDKIAQNIFLAAPSIAQHAALHAFDEKVIQQLEIRREEFRQRRDYLYPALESLGFIINKKPQGAFYLYAECSNLTEDSFHLSNELLYKAGVAVTPGIDFGHHKSNTHVRFAYTRNLAQLQQAIQRMQLYFSANG